MWKKEQKVGNQWPLLDYLGCHLKCCPRSLRIKTARTWSTEKLMLPIAQLCYWLETFAWYITFTVLKYWQVELNQSVNEWNVLFSVHKLLRAKATLNKFGIVLRGEKLKRHRLQGRAEHFLFWESLNFLNAPFHQQQAILCTSEPIKHKISFGWPNLYKQDE